MTPERRARARGRPGQRGSRPDWLRVRLRTTPEFEAVRRTLEEQKLHTVCYSAACPNLGECWARGTATFMIGGNRCTRRCGFCDVTTGRPEALDPFEPARVAEAVRRLGLRFAVITCVARDDLPDGGAGQMAATVRAIRRRCPETGVEVLIADYKGDEAALRTVLDAAPDVLNHNLETVERLYRIARPGGRYHRALRLLRRAKEMDAGLLTKSGLMVGLGEEWDELLAAIRHLRDEDVDLLTIGQYLRPSDGHLPVARFYSPEEFAQLREAGQAMGYRHVESGPLVRSSYHAWEQVQRAGAGT